ncbi:hypothetical protein N7539_009011 [Penicillium diatomitis]|uniref:Uncharacterized protein n=1 Tax=Penicillium diatomitis TaxID=2819901 RepID=A0A9W9WKZ1_9EURO|nr:uncharacterized protein N7539_009011 [Penicillium diatomitis]KAJ5469393.1 hypothetical protein N7539_009011 [Penicillium diatomitis]
MVPTAILLVRYRLQQGQTSALDQKQYAAQPQVVAPAGVIGDSLNSNDETSPYKLSIPSIEELVPPNEVVQDRIENNPVDQNSQAQALDVGSGWQRYTQPHESKDDVSIVAARSGPESTDWIEEFCDEYLCTPYIYSLDEFPEEEYLVPYSRKGHEASAYLSYIVDNYDNLAPYTIFIHGRAEQWHNDVSGPFTPKVLENLRYEAVAINGYVNLRCTNKPGCPSTMFQAHPVTLDWDYQYLIDQLPQVLGYLLGIDPSEAPQDIGHQCCAQFAVTRERIQERPLEDYIRILDWVANTDLTDNYGIGWLIEKLWHLFFGMPAVQ